MGDGTVFGSAKEGVIICKDSVHCGTSEGKFSVLLDEIAVARRLSGWPDYGIEIETFAADIYRISATCFEKRQDGLVDFFNALAATDLSETPPQDVDQQDRSDQTSGDDSLSREKQDRSQVVRRRSKPNSATAAPELRVVDAESVSEPVIVDATLVQRSTVQNVNASLKLLAVCEDDRYEDVEQLFEAATRSEKEWPLVKGYCKYVGFNGREVDGIFLITNQRVLIFSMEIGAKIVFVEVTRRLLGKLPVPFFDTIACFFLFSIPRMIYTALRGGHERLIEKALSVSEHRLISDKPGMRLVQSYDFSRMAETVSQVDIGSGVWTGILSRSFGVSFAPLDLSKTFRIPKDLILAEYESLEPFERLLAAIRSTLRGVGLDYQLDSSGQKLSIVPAVAERRAAA